MKNMANIEEPYVSIILPVYNVEPWLAECIDSVIRQTLEDIELVCINDGSTDGSMTILQRYAEMDCRIRIIDQENKGLSEARNVGVKAAQGKYLFFMDSDDLLELDALEQCINKMESLDLEYLCFNAIAFGDDVKGAEIAGVENRSYYRRALNANVLYSGEELFAELKRNGDYIAPVWTCVITRAAVINNDLWFHPNIYHEDEPWTFAVLMALSRCGCINKILYRHRIRGGSIMQKDGSFSHAYSTFVGACDAQQMLARHILPENEELRKIEIGHAVDLQRLAISWYRTCSEEERRKRYNIESPEERILFEKMVAYPASLEDRIEQQRRDYGELFDLFEERGKNYAKLEANYYTEKKKQKDKVRQLKQENKQFKQENKQLKKQLKGIKESKFYQIGRMATRIPRKLNKTSKKETKQESNRNRIKILPSAVSGNHIVYQYKVSGEWASFITKKNKFEITYPFSLEDIPESIRIIPLLAQILPLSWVCDAEVQVPQCDNDFYTCLDEVMDGYRKMYPMVSFGGTLKVDSIESNTVTTQKNNSLVCFSGGVDALSTTIAHLSEKPVLVSVWGSAVPDSDEEGWEYVEKLIRENAEKLGLETITIQSAFRKLLFENKLDKYVEKSGDSWWHGFQHGLGLYGHMAPVAWKLNANKVYIASSYTAADVYTCASDPTIDNYVRFCGSKVVHDGYDLNRQQKIQRIVDYSKHNNVTIPVHVCREKRRGDNCCHCEKCWRTILGFFAEGADPKEYGFSDYNGFQQLPEDLRNDYSQFKTRAAPNYAPIQKRLNETLAEREYNTDLSWFLEADLQRIEDGTLLLLKEGKLVEPIWLLGTPEHNNLGDQCIAEAEIHYLKSLFPGKQVIEITENELIQDMRSQLDIISASQTVFLHGGGNLGSIWAEPEMIRQGIIHQLPDNQIIILPQSIWYSKDDEGQAALLDAKATYHGDKILLCCRDKVSFDIARDNFNCRAILVPDMVMWDTKAVHSTERYGALTLLRRDKERIITDTDRAEMEAILFKSFKSIEADDTVRGYGIINCQNRDERIDELIRLISSVECVVTDRLHGMVLCALTGTPCVVLGNSYHEIEACYYDWLKDLGYIQFIKNTGELERAIDVVCNCSERDYPATSMKANFDLLSQYINDLKKGTDGR